MMPLPHRMPTTLRECRKTSVASFIRKETIEETFLGRLVPDANSSTYDDHAVTLIVGIASMAVDRLVAICRSGAVVYGFGTSSLDRRMLHFLADRFPANTDILQRAEKELSVIDRTPIGTIEPNEDEIASALLAALRRFCLKQTELRQWVR